MVKDAAKEHTECSVSAHAAKFVPLGFGLLLVVLLPALLPRLRFNSVQIRIPSSSTPTIAAIPIPMPAPPEIVEPEECEPEAELAEVELAGEVLLVTAVELVKNVEGMLEES